MSNDNQELLKKLIDDDEFLEDVELQKNHSKKSPMVIATAIVVSDPKKITISRRKAGRKGGGCPCWCKCIGWTVLVFTLLSFLMVGCTYVWLNGMLKKAVEEFTIESPQKFDIIEMSDLKQNIVKDRVMLFVDELSAARHDGPATVVGDLVLTQDEINGFIGHSDYLRGNMIVSLHKNLIEEEYSLPMDVLGYEGRYFVGNDYLKLGQEEEQDQEQDYNNNNKNTIEMKMTTAASHEDWFDGPLFFAKIQYLITKSKDDAFGETMLGLFLEKGSIFGQDAPQDYIDQHENLLDYLYYGHSDDDDYDYYDDDIDMEAIRNIIANIQSVSIEEGRIVVKARSD